MNLHINKNWIKVLLCILPFIVPAQISFTLQPNGALGKDAFVSNCVPCGSQTLNYGSDDELPAIAWTNGGNPSNARGLLQFDLTGIPIGSTILSAQLSLYHNPSGNNPGHSSLTNSNASYLQRVIQQWGENTVTWNTQPTTTTVNAVSLAQSTSTNQNYLNINVTALIQDMVDNPTTSYGFMLRLQNEVNYCSMLFASSDHTNTALHPKLVVTYVSDTGISEAKQNVDWDVFPNPTKGIFSIRTTDADMKIEVYNTNGEKIASGLQDKKIDLSSFDKGIYFIKAISGKNSGVKKIIVQ